MLTLDDVARACLALPATTEAVSASGRRRWLDRLDDRGLTELVTEAWASRASRRLLAEHPFPAP